MLPIGFIGENNNNKLVSQDSFFLKKKKKDSRRHQENDRADSSIPIPLTKQGKTSKILLEPTLLEFWKTVKGSQ